MFPRRRTGLLSGFFSCDLCGRPTHKEEAGQRRAHLTRGGIRHHESLQFCSVKGAVRLALGGNSVALVGAVKGKNTVASHGKMVQKKAAGTSFVKSRGSLRWEHGSSCL